MLEISTSGLMSGEEKRAVISLNGTVPRFSSTLPTQSAQLAVIAQNHADQDEFDSGFIARLSPYLRRKLGFDEAAWAQRDRELRLLYWIQPVVPGNPTGM